MELAVLAQDDFVDGDLWPGIGGREGDGAGDVALALGPWIEWESKHYFPAFISM